MMAPVHPLSTCDIGTAMPGPVDEAKLKFKYQDCSPLQSTSGKQEKITLVWNFPH